MQWLRSTVREIYGLFVEDGSFAAGLLAWMLVACVALRFLDAGHWGGPALVLGFAAVLVESVLRTARRRR